MRMLIVVAASAALAGAQMPRFHHAQVESRAAQGDLAAQMHTAARSASPVWWGYAVPAVRPEHDNCGVAYLEDGYNQRTEAAESEDATATVAVLYRLQAGSVDKLRVFSNGCEIDAGGLPVVWLTGVAANQSVALDSALAASNPNLASSALAAIGLTAGDNAEKALEAFTTPSQPDKLRNQAVFWLGNERGHAGFLALQRLARSDASESLRDRITFGLSQSHDPDALGELIRMAKTDASPKVRGQALFWLGQKASRQAAAAITDAINNDPDTAVKKRAVFGLSQLPHGDGVPLLIQVAENNPNPAVRKQAMFWLGQSRDPRALEFFEKVLAKP